MPSVPVSHRLVLRSVALLVAVLSLVLWFIRNGTGTPVEPLWVRALVAAAWLGYLAATFMVPAVRRNPQGWILWPVATLLPLLYLGIVQLQFSWKSLPGVLMVMFCASLLLLDRRSLLLFLAGVWTVVLCGLLVVPQPEALPAYYVAIVAGTSLMILLSQELRFRALESLKETEARMRRAQSLERIGGWEYRLQEDRFELSPELRQMMAWDDELLRDPARAAGLVAAADLDALRTAAAATRTRAEPFAMELQARAGDGSVRHLRIAGEPVFDSRGSAMAVIGLAHDITQDVTNNEALREARDAAQQAAEARARFLANMSHEIRTPLNGVIGMTQLLSNTELDAEQRDCVEIIRTSSEALMAIINDILDISRIDAGRIELEHADFDLESAVADSLALFAGRAAGKGIELSVLVEPFVPRTVCADAARLSQVLANLVSNAVKFTEHGEVHVHVGGQWLGEDRFELQVTVRDTGIGIAPERVDQLFDAFTQEDVSTTRRYGGTGLGLSICRHLVKLMGGVITAESRPVGGATFRFTVPLDACRDAQPPPADLQGQAVLVVDDNATSRHILTRLLESSGAHVTVTGKPGEGLQAAAQKAFTHYLLDWQMPEMDGVELAARLRELHGDRCPPIVLLSPLGADIPDRTLFDAVVSKPVRADVLRTTLSRGADRPANHTCPQSTAQVTTRVLLVEDNPVNQKVAARLLERAGLTPRLAANGRQALAAFAEQDWDLVFMDVQMPEMDGIEATTRIRTLADGRDAWIVAMTANAMPGDRERCISAGMNDYLAKPVTQRALQEAISRWQQHCGSLSGVSAS